jgi:hypothetical protein
MSDHYLVWSVEHQGWWHRQNYGYAARLSEARRFSRAEALKVCTEAIPGQAHREGYLHELPVRLDDVKAMQTVYHRDFFILPLEDWE